MAKAEHVENEVFFLPDNLEECQAELTETRREMEELKDKFLRAAAQIENVRKWTERDILARSKENQRRLLRQFLEVADNLERALAQPADPEVLAQGVQLTLRQFETILSQAGVERIPAKAGDSFDPTYHEAVEIRKRDVDEPAIDEIVQPGYLHEKELLRPARVVVAMPEE